ncbi:ABC transporter ATP-binding protein [Microtetraspora sp. NBRC 13810]|uniref:ABC transporter ATP-binding protein n=1 Tax=Microtetraspora sp. NBRC 13810 TaxID=3030990 RepID=UPI0024A3762A|nr:ABC transporter ATP-binding protein [Microtetraspora sp. NBRC 13810]GLW09319.1 ABC transporter ATP-binding protein [Microtetraspora sp. NBRC 13810]
MSTAKPGETPLLAGDRGTVGTAVPARSRGTGLDEVRGTSEGASPPSPPAQDCSIVTRGLTKRFRGGQVAVDDLHLAVPRGSVFGFLGPNGSGKTTTIRMLLGLVTPTSGGCEVLGEELPGGLGAALPRVGAVVEGPAFYPYLSGAANLRRFDAADPAADRRTAPDRIGAALDRVGLSAAAGKRYRAYSLGMRQRLAIAAALLRPRDLLILDEPTNGLDPQGTREVRALVREIAADGTTVFVSSHLLAEVEQMCTHIAVMRTGRLVAQGPLAELRGGAAPRIRIETPDAARAAAVLGRLGLAAVRAGEGEASAEPGEVPTERICAELVGDGVAVRGLAVQRPSLEDVFVRLTGEGFDVDG